MDYILLTFCIFFGSKGFFKGLLNMLFSMIGVIVIVGIAWQIKDYAIPIVEKFGKEFIFDFIKSKLDSNLPGTFSDLSQFQNAVANSNFSLFGVFIFRLLKDLYFSGDMTAGQILAPSITNLFIKIITFVAIFISLYFLLKIIKLFLRKIIKKCGLNIADRIFGFLFGLLKGIVLFGILYFVLSSIANLTLNFGLLNFVKNGVISNFIYDNFISKIVVLFY